MRPVMHNNLAQLAPKASNSAWAPSYPNPADFMFNYYQLLNAARSNKRPIGQAPAGGATVAIIGAGCAGLTAARELKRAGYFVVLVEASDRIGGRHYTLNTDDGTATEMGAMRFPFFSAPGSGNSVLDYYLNTETQAILSNFPNPGAAPGNTGIYMNQGYGPNGSTYPNREMLIWEYPNKMPPNEALANVQVLVNRFIDVFSSIVGPVYGTAQWPTLWAQIANYYDKMSFSDLVFAAIVEPSEYQNDGWIGGFGMTESQSQLFYTIGSGDGSWGAFYEIGAMWFIRCVMFGFNTNLQTVAGLENPTQQPYYGVSGLVDSSGNPIASPTYVGIQALDEWLFFAPPPEGGLSLMQAVQERQAQVYLNSPVTKISPTSNGISIWMDNEQMNGFSVDHVIVTPQIWAAQLNIDMSGFERQDLPLEVNTALADQHIIGSAKLFFPLKSSTPYWETTTIPQIIVSDTFVQDAYGIQWDPTRPGALLASYTWEDDAIKLLPFSEEALAKKVLHELDTMLVQTGHPPISPFLDVTKPTLMQWTSMPGYNGCAKLYRQRNWAMCYQLLTYNQNFSASSHVYLAGETYGVEGGWTEPALRGALDAVIHVINNSNGTFNNGFSFADYPKFAMDVDPNENYPAQT